MVNPMQLEDHKFTAWLDRLVEARKNRQERRQRPYRNVQWVQKEIEIFEKAGIIAKSVSPWASLIVIVPKKTAPGEPP